jgi:hypothetical protein
LKHNFDVLLDSALEKAGDTATLTDLKTVADISKLIAEAEKAKNDLAHSRTQLSLERIKSLATVLVPIASLVTVAFTIFVQYLQLGETQRQNEATQWRDFLSASNNFLSLQNDPTFAPRMLSFFSSPQYRDQAISISKGMMGGLTNKIGFINLFDAVFPSVDDRNISDIADVGKLLNINEQSSYSDCQRFFDQLDEATKSKIPSIKYTAGICSPVIAEKTIKELGLESDQEKLLSKYRRTVFALEEENGYVSEKIAAFLRANYPVGSASNKKIQLAKIYLIGSNLSNVDFSNIDISDAVIDDCNLDGSKLVPFKGIESIDFRGSAWWEASAIDQTLLNRLVETNFPFIDGREAYKTSGKVEKERYESRLTELCKPLTSICSSAQFGTQK